MGHSMLRGITSEHRGACCVRFTSLLLRNVDWFNERLFHLNHPSTYKLPSSARNWTCGGPWEKIQFLQGWFWSNRPWPKLGRSIFGRPPESSYCPCTWHFRIWQRGKWKSFCLVWHLFANFPRIASSRVFCSVGSFVEWIRLPARGDVNFSTYKSRVDLHRSWFGSLLFNYM